MVQSKVNFDVQSKSAEWLSQCYKLKYMGRSSWMLTITNSVRSVAIAVFWFGWVIVWSSRRSQWFWCWTGWTTTTGRRWAGRNHFLFNRTTTSGAIKKKIIIIIYGCYNQQPTYFRKYLLFESQAVLNLINK